MPRRLHSSMKCVALSADSENSTPLLATMPTRKPCRRAKPVTSVGRVALLELVEARAVDDARDHLAHVVRLAEVGVDDAVESRPDRRPGRLGRGHVRGQLLARVQRRDDRPRLMQRVLVVFGEVVGHAGEARVHVGAAQFLGRHLLAGGGLHERRTAEKDRAGALDDDGLVGHRGHVGAAGGARTHDDRDLRNALGRHPRLVEEDAAEVIAIGEDLGLQRQERAAGVHQIHARQPVLQRDLLRAHVLLHRDAGSRCRP